MLSQKRFALLYAISAVCFLTLFNPSVATAQCKPGEQVEYRAQSWPEKWEVGTCVKELPGGKQVLIREKPSQFYPEGFERAYALDEVRPIQKAPLQAPNNGNVTPALQPENEAKDNAPNAAGGPTMSQQDVLSFLRERLGNGDPFMNPKREQVLQQLRDEILTDEDAVVIIEWAERMGRYPLPNENVWRISISGDGEEPRTIVVEQAAAVAS